MQSEDEVLLERYRCGGSEEAFAALARKYAGLLYHTALRRTGDSGLAEEAAQNVLAILARKSGSLFVGVSLAGWLHRSVCFEAAKLARREKRHHDRMKKLHQFQSVLAESPGGNPERPVLPEIWEEVNPHLDEALNELSGMDRQVVLLKYADGWSFEEMARRLGGQSATWRQRGSRALERLRQRLARRGVLVPLSVLAAGLAPVLTQSAPAAVTAALLQAPLLGAAGLSWKSTLLHTFYSMNTKQLSITAGVAAALLFPPGYQAWHLSRTASEIAQLNERIAGLEAAATPANQYAGGAVLARTGAPASGGGGSGEPGKSNGKSEFDLQELAKLMAEGRNADPLRVLDFRSRLAAMSAREIQDLLTLAESQDFPPAQRRPLYERLLSALSEKDPAAGMSTGMQLAKGLTGEDATQFWMNPLPNALRRWALQDGAAAEAWYQKQLKDGVFENKALGNADVDGWMAAGLFTGLMTGSGREAAMEIFATLDDAGKGIALRRFGTSNPSEEDRGLILKLTRQIQDPGARTDALLGPVQMLSRQDLDRTSEYIEQAGLPSAEARKLLVAAAVEPLRSTPDVDLDARLAWLRSQSPIDQKEKALGYFLGEATFADHAGVRAKVEAELEAGASDAFLGAFIRNAAHRTSTMDIAASFLPRLTDPMERQRTLQEIQQGHTGEARTAALAAGISRAELDEARTSR